MNMYIIPQSKLNYCFLAIIYLFSTGLKCLLIGGENKQLKNKWLVKQWFNMCCEMFLKLTMSMLKIKLCHIGQIGIAFFSVKKTNKCQKWGTYT